MSIRLKNYWNYVGNDRWDWEVYVDSDSLSELEDIDHVKYILHSTFPDPIRIVREKNDGFRLKTNGWGTFLIRAFVYFKGGSKLKLEHTLQLASDPPKGTSG